jgi:hypothetical protein
VIELEKCPKDYRRNIYLKYQVNCGGKGYQNIKAVQYVLKILKLHKELKYSQYVDTNTMILVLISGLKMRKDVLFVIKMKMKVE